MEDEAFRVFLKRGGRSSSAIERCVRMNKAFESFLESERGGVKLAEADSDDLEAFVAKTGFQGVATLPAEARYTVAKARELPFLVEE